MFVWNVWMIFSVDMLDLFRAGLLSVCLPLGCAQRRFTHVVSISKIFLLSIRPLLQRAVSEIHSFFKMCISHSLSITVENKMMVLLKTYGLNILLKDHSHVQTMLNFIAVDLKTRYLEMDFILIFKLLNSEYVGKMYSTFCLHSGALEITTLKLVFVSGFFPPSQPFVGR